MNENNNPYNGVADLIKKSMETQLLVYIGLELIKEIHKREQLRFETKINIDDIRGIKEQEIAIMKGWC